MDLMERLTPEMDKHTTVKEEPHWRDTMYLIQLSSHLGAGGDTVDSKLQTKRTVYLIVFSSIYPESNGQTNMDLYSAVIW